MSETNFNVKFVPILKTQSESFQKIFTGCKDGFVMSVPGGFVTTPDIAAEIEKIREIKPRKDDVWLLSFYKSGTCCY